MRPATPGVPLLIDDVPVKARRHSPSAPPTLFAVAPRNSLTGVPTTVRPKAGEL